MTNDEKADLFDWLCEHAESVAMVLPNTGVVEWPDGLDTLAEFLQSIKE